MRAAGFRVSLLRQHAGIGLPAPRCRPLDDAVGPGSGGYFVSCVLPYPPVKQTRHCSQTFVQLAPLEGEFAMRVSAKTEYACIAMLELASQFGTGEPVRIRWIAERHRRSAAVPGANPPATEGGRAGGQRSWGGRRVSAPQAAPTNLPGPGHGSHRRLAGGRQPDQQRRRPIRPPSGSSPRPGRTWPPCSGRCSTRSRWPTCSKKPRRAITRAGMDDQI